MAKHELTIKASYLSGWGIWEGVRELIQNARDAEVQFNAPMTVKFSERQRNGKKTGAIIISNEGATLPKEALLIGHTSKDGDDRLIGKFGEGLKFGILGLLRLGVEVKIRNGSEVWVPSIERSEKFNADVLVFRTTSGHKHEERVQFEVVGIEKADWENIERKLLFLGKYPESVKVFGGNILTDREHSGKLFVKGMFVAQTQAFFGYDFEDADIDRDRRMVNDLHDKCSYLLARAVNQGSLAEQVFSLMEEGKEEASYVTSYRLDAQGIENISKQFSKKNPGIIPVQNAEQVKELESMGKKGRQVPWNLRTILEQKLGNAADTIRTLRMSEKRTYDTSELTQEERDNLRLAISLVGRACHKLGDVVVSKENVMVVDFGKPDLFGTYDPNSGVVRLARSILNNKARTVYTFVHEVAHTHGGDGIRSHEETIGKIMEEILKELL